MTDAVTIHQGALGADYWSLTATLTPQWLRSIGVSYVLRYIARGTSTKIVTAQEIAALHKAGIAVLLNYEGGESDLLAGAFGGARNGAWSRDKARSLGYPEHLPLFVSVDTDVHAANAGSARAYVRSFMSAANPYAPAVYGDTDIAAETADLHPIFWRAYATGWGAVRPGQIVHIQQRRVTTTPEGSIDPNVCITAFDAWLPGEVAPAPPKPTPMPTPPQQGDIMNVLFQIVDEHGAPAAAALFYAQVDAAGNALQCEWTGDGNPSTPTGHKLAAHLTAGLTVRKIGFGSLLNMTLLGPKPIADPLHVWTDADFARVIGG